VRDALKRRVERKVKDIAIEISGSTVNLRSRVNSSHERDAAPDVAWSSPGVRAVINDLRIG
jgi:hyperosmotically inducible protein